jgi:NTP pyrophosphatase (non-canonical NTP hydrolase)
MTSISELQEICGKAAAAKGFHDDRPDSYTTADRRDLANWQGNKLMLIVSEVAEAQDELRKGNAAALTYYPTATVSTSVDGPHKPEGVPSELADTVIRVLDFCYTEGIDLEAIIEEKLAYNATRPRLHGKQF